MLSFLYELVHSWRSRLLLLKRLLALRKLSRLSAQVHRWVKLRLLVIFLDRGLLCEVLRSLLHLFAMGVVILESLRLLNEVLRLLNEALLAVSAFARGAFQLLWGFE